MSDGVSEHHPTNERRDKSITPCEFRSHVDKCGQRQYADALCRLIHPLPLSGLIEESRADITQQHSDQRAMDLARP